VGEDGFAGWLETAERMATVTTSELHDCHDCGVKPGELHTPGCDVQRCPRCGMQQIGCNCIYEVNNIDVDDMETEHPSIYKNGPTKQMYAKWDVEWGTRQQLWTGEWPGIAECREYGFWCLWDEANRRWMGWPKFKNITAETPGAQEDLNRLVGVCRWDIDAQKWMQRR